MQAIADDVYYEGAGKIALQRKLALIARERLYQRFIDAMQLGPDTTILDVGASDRETREANTLEKNYPHPQNITCGLIGNTERLQENHPLVKVAKMVPGAPFPFADKEFDIVYSNAVFEHVGPAAQRALFLKESLRVAKSLFFVVPNGWFPIEHHTGVPFLHYIPSLFRWALRDTGYDYWSKVENLDFLTPTMLKAEWPQGKVEIELGGLNLGPLSSNIVIMVRTAG